MVPGVISKREKTTARDKLRSSALEKMLSLVQGTEICVILSVLMQ